MFKFIFFVNIFALISTSLFASVSEREPHVTVYDDKDFSGAKKNIFVGDIAKGKQLLPVKEDALRSLKIPHGLAAEVCVNQKKDTRGPCEIYYEDVKRLPDRLRKKITYVRAFEVNPNYFSLIMASDPQFDWRIGPKERTTGDKSKDAKISNEYHVAVMNELQKEDPDSLLGVVVNGDLTAYGHSGQLDDFRKYYGVSLSKANSKSLILPIYPGLGNHDYHNNIRPDVTALSGKGCANNLCADRMVNFMRDFVTDNPHIKYFDPASLSYAWNYRGYMFVQMHNYPTYEVEYETFTLTFKRLREKITSGVFWLEQMLKIARDKNLKTVLNFHDLGDKFKGTNEFKTLAADYDIGAIFVGHIHKSVGKISSFRDINDKKIPVFRCGSASYNVMNIARFYEDKIEVDALSTWQGKKEIIESNEVKFK